LRNGKGQFKGKERIQEIATEVGTVTTGRLEREVKVTAVKNRPIFENPDGESKGAPRVEVVISRGRGNVALTVNEAKRIWEMLGRVLPDAEAAHQALEQERKEWFQRDRNDAGEEDDWKGPGNRGAPRRTGKTERQKKKGKAGEAYHRKRKAEMAQKNREINQNMGRNK
jgi:hypothetical protein